jgi:hypothetical protein
MATSRTIGLAVLLCASIARAGDAGMEAHVDPLTGTLVPEAVGPVIPVPALPPPALPAAEIPAPGGGMMIDIRGRFMSSVVATVAPDGSVHLDCVSDDGHVHP